MVGDEGAGEELTVGRLARRFGLARSTLLYYDRIGVLRPSARSAAGYRLYDAGDVERLARVCHFREVGLPLDVVRGLLDGPDDVTSALAERLVALDRQAAELERQRQAILAYLGGDGTRRAEQFTALLAAVAWRLRARLPQTGLLRPEGHQGAVSIAHVLQIVALTMQAHAGCPVTLYTAV